MSSRTFDQECEFIEKLDPCTYRIKQGFVPNMKVDGRFYVNDSLKSLVFDELKQQAENPGAGGFLPAVKQIANVASLPGIVGRSMGMPDLHSGYGFSIGNVAAFDMNDPKAIVSPGGVGFDINCFAEDHQILTLERGFVGLDAISPELHVAGVHAGRIVYQRPLRVIVNDSRAQTMVDVTPAEHQHEWAATAAMNSLSEGQPAEESLRGPCGVSILATENHDLFVAPAATKAARGDSVVGASSEQVFAKMPARELADGTGSFRLQACVSGGLEPGADAGAWFARRLGLSTPGQLGSALWLLGVWRRGQLLADVPLCGGDAAEPVFRSAGSGRDGRFVRSQLARAGLTDGVDFCCRPVTTAVAAAAVDDDEVEFVVSNPAWVACFRDLTQAPGSASNSTSCLSPVDTLDCPGGSFLEFLLFQLNRERSRAVLSGMSLGSPGRVLARSPERRDEVVRLALHAGYTVQFEQQCRQQLDGNAAAEVTGKSKVCSGDGYGSGPWAWIVCFEEPGKSGAAAPEFSVQRDVRRVQYTGRTWCVTTPSSFVIVRRAVTDPATGQVTAASQPTVQGNCGVRLIRTNLFEKDVAHVKEELAQSLFDHIPVGVGSKGVIPTTMQSLEEALEMGMDWSLREGYAWSEDKMHAEEFGRMLQADASKVSARAKKRGNHYAEIQVVDKVFDKAAARTMGIGDVGQVVVFVHSGSRGLGHQVATDALVAMERAVAQQNIQLNDRQLACARIQSTEGRDYLAAMGAAANFAWVNRQSMTFLVRQTFARMFQSTPDDLDMHVVYDVSHNIAKVEEHMVDGKPATLLVHRKGATRAFPPMHPLIPADYQFTGQPVLIGGTMGTASYVLTGTERGMAETFGSTCHGAGRAQSRNKARRNLDHTTVLESLRQKGISIRIASPKLVTEEADSSYKDVNSVVDTCEAVGISKKCVKLRPICVIKG